MSSFKDKKANGYKGNSAGKANGSDKVKPAKQSGVSKKSAASNKPSSPKGSYHKSNSMLKRIGIIVICAILVLALMIPSFMSLFSNSSTSSSSSSSASATATPSADSVNSQYEDTVNAIVAKVQEDPTNTSYLETLTSEYYQWALALMDVASSTDDYNQVVTCLSNTLTYANQYFDAGGTSESIQMERAIATYYLGDTDTAISYMQAVCDADPSNASAWANLGMFYQAAGNNDDAKTAYNNALSYATDSQSNLKEYVNQQLSSMSS